VPVSFARDADGWTADYADYDLAQEPTMNFAAGHERLPPPLDNAWGLAMACDNRSDDVFMYLTKRVEGLVPGQRYRVDSTIAVATNVPPFCPGAGGGPGEANCIKAGAAPFRPEKQLRGSFYVVNVDKGDQSAGGANASVIGDLAQAVPGGACPAADYQRKTLSSGTTGVLATADAAGGLWLILGDDSGYEGWLKFYWLDGTIRLVPA